MALQHHLAACNTCSWFPQTDEAGRGRGAQEAGTGGARTGEARAGSEREGEEAAGGSETASRASQPREAGGGAGEER